MSYPFSLAITGASGARYALRLLDVLLAQGHEVHLSISPAGRDVLAQEMDIAVDLNSFGENFDASVFPLAETAAASKEGKPTGRLRCFHYQDYMAPMASGTAKSSGMVICPCSGSTLSAVAHGSSGNLIQRAAEVHLKERRPLVLVPREAPLSLPTINNMQLAAQAGAIILPASPGWYHQPQSLDDLVEFMVSRICDQIGVENPHTQRWGMM